MSTKRSRILKQTCSSKLQVCLSMFDLLVDTRQSRLNANILHNAGVEVVLVSSTLKSFQLCQKQPPEVFYKKRYFKNFGMFTGKNLCWCLFLIKLQALKACNFIKKRLQHKCFSVNIAKFTRTFVLKNICEQLLLYRAVA